MSETPAEQPAAHPWLPLQDTGTIGQPDYLPGVLTWLQVDPTGSLAGVAEWCRQASARFCERQRADLFPIVDGVLTFAGDADTIMAGYIGAARLYARRSSPAGLASFGEFGATEVLRYDPDMARLLGTGRHAPPAVG